MDFGNQMIQVNPEPGRKRDGLGLGGGKEKKTCMRGGPRKEEESIGK